MDLTTGGYITIPLIGTDNPIAIDYDPLNRIVYWTDVGSKQIRKANIDNRQVSTLLQLGSSEYLFETLIIDKSLHLKAYLNSVQCQNLLFCDVNDAANFTELYKCSVLTEHSL